jgi:hypothetical protein
MYSSHAKSIGAAADVHGVAMAVIALARIVAFGMAIHAARMPEHRLEGLEERPIRTVGG